MKTCDDNGQLKVCVFTSLSMVGEVGRVNRMRGVVHSKKILVHPKKKSEKSEKNPKNPRIFLRI